VLAATQIPAQDAAPYSLELSSNPCSSLLNGRWLALDGRMLRKYHLIPVA